MTDLFYKIHQSIDQLNGWIGRKIAWLTAALVLLIVYDVAMRYLFNHSKVWINELEWHLFAFVFLLSAAYAFQQDRHVRVDLFYVKMRPKKQAWINLLGNLIFLIPWCSILIVSSWDYAYTAFTQKEGSPNPGGLPFRFVVKASITLGFVLLLLQGFSNIIKSVLIIFDKIPMAGDTGKTEIKS